MSKTNDTKHHSQQSQQQKKASGDQVFQPEKQNGFFDRQATPSTFFVQRKVKIGEPNDHYEKQADKVADKVVQKMSQPQTVQAKPNAPAIKAPTINAAPKQNLVQEKPALEDEKMQDEPVLQRKPIFDSMGDPPDDHIRRKPTTEGPSPKSQPDLSQRLQKTKGGGAPLPKDTKNAMESAMGADFSNVRVHTDKEANQLSNDIQAQAFTHGNDIYFNEGKFDAASSTGRHLLAHELTHTVQQGAAVQRKEMPTASLSPMIQRDPAPAAAAPGEVVDISSGQFNPSEALKTAIREAKRGLDVNVTGGKVAGAGTIKVREKDGVFESLKDGYLPMQIQLLEQANPNLAVRIAAGQVSGFATIGKNSDLQALAKWIKSNAKTLGWLSGLDIESLSGGVTNTFEGGNFTFTVNGIKVKVGEFAKATMNLGWENMKPTGDVTADLDVKGLAQTNLNITLKDGAFSGTGKLTVNLKNFTGDIEAKFEKGVLDIKGEVGYDGDKLSGKVMVMMTDKATADNFAVQQTGGGENAQEAAMPAEIPAPTGPGERGVAGMGSLTFNLTEWFAGQVNVIIDGKGCVTVVGKIAPPKEIILFEQKDYNKELFKLEARAAYGLPVIGNVFVFANVSLSALAKMGPAKIYNIEVNGTWSNNPDVAKNISLSGSLNISAYAGLRLRAEGGVGVQILDHDLKLGVGVNADAGVKGYVDARPTIGYRDPGEFFFKGHMEIGAQPFLGLSGDLFAELDSPWWSPLPDEKWTWPLGALEYPLPGEFGIGADMEYVLGSGKIPEVSFTETKFDGSKFMTDLVDKQVPGKGGGGDKGDKKGKFVDGGAAGAAPKAAPAPAPAPQKGGDKGGAKGGGGKKKDDKAKDAAKPDELKNFKEGMTKLKALEGHKPMTKDEVTVEVEKVKKQHNIPNIVIVPKDGEWKVTGTMNGGKKTKQSVKIKANLKDGDDKKDDKKDPAKEKKLNEAKHALVQKDGSEKDKNKSIPREEANKIADSVEKQYSDVMKDIKVMDKDKHWQYQYVQRNPTGTVTGAATPAAPAYPKDLKDGATFAFKGDPEEMLLECHGLDPNAAGGPSLKAKVLSHKDRSQKGSTRYFLLTRFTPGAYELSKAAEDVFKIVGGVTTVGQNVTYKTFTNHTMKLVLDKSDFVEEISSVGLYIKPSNIIGKVDVSDVNVPGMDPKFVLQRGHVLAERFLGVAHKGAHNLIAVSERYNLSAMKIVENKIAKTFASVAADTMSFNAKVKYGVLTDAVLCAKLKADFKAKNPGLKKSDYDDFNKSVDDQAVHASGALKRVVDVIYEVEFFQGTVSVGNLNESTGPDLTWKESTPATSATAATSTTIVAPVAVVIRRKADGSESYVNGPNAGKQVPGKGPTTPAPTGPVKPNPTPGKK